MSHRFNALPQSLSGGRTAACSIAMSVMRLISQDIYSADEPTGNLIEENRQPDYQAVYSNLNQSQGHDVVMVTAIITNLLKCLRTVNWSCLQAQLTEQTL